MNRHELRTQAMISLYQILLIGSDMEEVINNNYESNKDNYFINVIYNAVDNKETYIEKINDLLDGWTFDRLGFPEAAILLLGISELEMKEVDKRIIINEAILLAKEYGNEEAYPLINKVLDKYE